MYKLIRKVLFLLPEEIAHHVSLHILGFLPGFLFKQPKSNPVDCMGIKFPHQIGLAAGFDKNGKHLQALAKLGFAFIEVGTVTPRPQPGNPKPRLFRLINSHALINRMGFNNQGVDKLLMNIQKSNYKGILGINIGKNKDTPLHDACSDYIYCMRRVYKHADYITINISSPNTQDLRKLQSKTYLENFVETLCAEHSKLHVEFGSYVPLAIKISPDESEELIENLAHVALKYNIDAIIATNTSNFRDNLITELSEAGGLSGQPILGRANQILAKLNILVGDKIDLIGVGGVFDSESARSKIANGAKLIQVYTGFIYCGPRLVRALEDKI